MIDPKNKRFQILSRERRAILPDGSQDVKDIKAKPSADIYKSIEAVPRDALPTLPVRELDGHQVIGFTHEVATRLPLGEHLLGGRQDKTASPCGEEGPQ